MSHVKPFTSSVIKFLKKPKLYNATERIQLELSKKHLQTPKQFEPVLTQIAKICRSRKAIPELFEFKNLVSDHMPVPSSLYNVLVDSCARNIKVLGSDPHKKLDQLIREATQSGNLKSELTAVKALAAINDVDGIMQRWDEKLRPLVSSLIKNPKDNFSELTLIYAQFIEALAKADQSHEASKFLTDLHSIIKKTQIMNDILPSDYQDLKSTYESVITVLLQNQSTPLHILDMMEEIGLDVDSKTLTHVLSYHILATQGIAQAVFNRCMAAPHIVRKNHFFLKLMSRLPDSKALQIAEKVLVQAQCLLPDEKVLSILVEYPNSFKRVLRPLFTKKIISLTNLYRIIELRQETSRSGPAEVENLVQILELINEHFSDERQIKRKHHLLQRIPSSVILAALELTVKHQNYQAHTQIWDKFGKPETLYLCENLAPEGLISKFMSHCYRPDPDIAAAISSMFKESENMASSQTLLDYSIFNSETPMENFAKLFSGRNHEESPIPFSSLYTLLQRLRKDDVSIDYILQTFNQYRNSVSSQDMDYHRVVGLMSQVAKEQNMMEHVSFNGLMEFFAQEGYWPLVSYLIVKQMIQTDRFAADEIIAKWLYFRQCCSSEQTTPNNVMSEYTRTKYIMDTLELLLIECHHIKIPDQGLTPILEAMQQDWGDAKALEVVRRTLIAVPNNWEAMKTFPLSIFDTPDYERAISRSSSPSISLEICRTAVKQKVTLNDDILILFLEQLRDCKEFTIEQKLERLQAVFRAVRKNKYPRRMDYQTWFTVLKCFVDSLTEFHMNQPQIRLEPVLKTTIKYTVSDLGEEMTTSLIQEIGKDYYDGKRLHILLGSKKQGEHSSQKETEE
eukprot:gb/GECH01009292.1/.p1 GENE.gb/GECH01009292.1/~~gb/GECH01009292.1/.p1  ORF type:complete len:850 (+),score=157.67 gb/GECH01009292.1/:1-2550(+)